MTPDTTPLLEEIRQRIYRSNAQSVAIAASHSASGRQIVVNADEMFYPASTFKIGVMMEAFRQARQGVFALDDTLPIRNEFRGFVDESPYALDIADDSDTATYASIGGTLSIRELVSRMITRSSNLATNVLLERITPDSVTSFMHQLGASGLSVCRGVGDHIAFAHGRNNATTARALMVILSRLMAQEVVSPDDSGDMIALLKAQYYNEGIPRHLPSSTSVAHKTGWIEQHYHDAAIVYPMDDAPYVLVILTRGLSYERDAPSLVADLSRLLYERRSEWR